MMAAESLGAWSTDTQSVATLAKVDDLFCAIGRRDIPAKPPCSAEDIRTLLWQHRGRFGITRIGSVTRLDRIGIPVVQAVRPNAQSNVVSQGKGRTVVQAFISATMEAIETWAAERIPERLTVSVVGEQDRNLFARHAAGHLLMPRVEGIDLFSGAVETVPLALVETRYIHPMPRPVPFDQTTTGLAAGFDTAAAIRHGLAEVVERYSAAEAEASGRFRRIDPRSIPYASTQTLVDRLCRSGVCLGLETADFPHTMPVWRCRVTDRQPETLPRIQAVGYGCRRDEEAAIDAALLEAVQARLAALSGSREDIMRDQYPPRVDHRIADDMRRDLIEGETTADPFDSRPAMAGDDIGVYLDALRQLGADAVYAVPVYRDVGTGLSVVRIVAPPLFGR